MKVNHIFTPQNLVLHGRIFVIECMGESLSSNTNCYSFDIFQSDPQARNMRYKAWPYFNDWSICFGKDRAGGERGTSFVETINNLVNGDNRPESEPVEDETAENVQFTPEGDNVSVLGGESNNSQKGKRKRGSSRTEFARHEDPKMAEMMSTFIANVHSQMGSLISKVGHEHDAAIARQGLFDALEPLTYLTVDQKLDAVKAIYTKKEYVDIFYGLSTANKAVMVARVLTGHW